MTLFSIIVPTYNQDQYLGQALDSILAQTESDWEAIIVNDGSTDSTKEILEIYAQKDSRFKVFHQANGGVGSALNYGLKSAQGKWICWLSSDDMFIDNKLEIHKDSIEQNPDCSFFFSNFHRLNNTTSETSTIQQKIPEQQWQILQLLNNNYIAGNSICIKRESWLKVGYFNETLRYGQDYDMWLRLMAIYPATFITKPTCIQRIHPEQDSNKFLEACFFDSAKSSINFLNTHTLADLFPIVDLSDFPSAKQVIENSLAVAAEANPHIYQLGWHPLLLLRIAEWVINECPNDQKAYFKQLIKRYSYKITQEFKAIPLSFWWEFMNKLITSEISRIQYTSISILPIAKTYYWWLKYTKINSEGLIKKYIERFENYDLDEEADVNYLNQFESNLLSIYQTIENGQVTKFDFKVDYVANNNTLINRLFVMEKLDFALSDIKEVASKYLTRINLMLIYLIILIRRSIRLTLKGELLDRFKGYLRYILFFKNNNSQS